MELKDILAVSGQPGLFRYVAQSPGGVIVESLIDKKRTLFPSNARVSSLTEIAVFTATEELPLAKVLEKIYAHTGGREAISRNSEPGQLQAFLAGVLPDYDRERVHASDIKKMITWFNILVGAGMTEFKLPEEEQGDEAKAEAKDGKAPAAKGTAAAGKSGASAGAAAKPAAGAPKAAAKAGAPKVKASDSAKGVAKAQRPRPKV